MKLLKIASNMSHSSFLCVELSFHIIILVASIFEAVAPKRWGLNLMRPFRNKEREFTWNQWRQQSSFIPNNPTLLWKISKSAVYASKISKDGWFSGSYSIEKECYISLEMQSIGMSFVKNFCSALEMVLSYDVIFVWFFHDLCVICVISHRKMRKIWIFS